MRGISIRLRIFLLIFMIVGFAVGVGAPFYRELLALGVFATGQTQEAMLEGQKEKLKVAVHSMALALAAATRDAPDEAARHERIRGGHQAHPLRDRRVRLLFRVPGHGERGPAHQARGPGHGSGPDQGRQRGPLRARTGGPGVQGRGLRELRVRQAGQGGPAQAGLRGDDPGQPGLDRHRRVHRQHRRAQGGHRFGRGGHGLRLGGPHRLHRAGHFRPVRAAAQPAHLPQHRAAPGPGHRGRRGGWPPGTSAWP